MQIPDILSAYYTYPTKSRIMCNSFVTRRRPYLKSEFMSDILLHTCYHMFAYIMVDVSMPPKKHVVLCTYELISHLRL